MLLAFCYFDFACGIKVRGENCFYQEDCDTRICEYVSAKKICVCLRLPDYTTGEIIEQLYLPNLSSEICRSKINQMCTMVGVKLDTRFKFECIDNSECIFTRNGIGSPEKYGTCACKNGFT